MRTSGEKQSIVLNIGWLAGIPSTAVFQSLLKRAIEKATSC
jgi:hypothetical protein